MSAIDAVSRDQFDVDDLGVDSPERPTMQPGEHMNPEQFQGLIGNHEAVPKVRRPNHVGSQTVHEYRTSPRSD